MPILNNHKTDVLKGKVEFYGDYHFLREENADGEMTVAVEVKINNEWYDIGRVVYQTIIHPDKIEIHYYLSESWEQEIMDTIQMLIPEDKTKDEQD